MFPLIRESEGAHAGLGEASTAPPGVADGEAHAAVAQPPAVAAVVLLEAPRCVQLTHQRQPGPLASAGVPRLLEGEGSREEGDGSWGRVRRGSLSGRTDGIQGLREEISPGLREVKQKASKPCSLSLGP